MAKEIKEKKEKKKSAGAEVARSTGKEEHVTPRLATKYREEVVPALMKRFNYKSVMQVPRIAKIALNVGVGAATQDAKLIDIATNEIELITGQKPIVTKAKKSISNFKLREEQAIGCKVTLRSSRMYEFLDRLVNVALPRIRDFRGVPDRSFDGRGNYTLGIKEQIIFPEIDVDRVNKISGMDITFVTTAKTDVEAYELLKSFGMPFRKREAQ